MQASTFDGQFELSGPFHEANARSYLLLLHAQPFCALKTEDVIEADDFLSLFNSHAVRRSIEVVLAYAAVEIANAARVLGQTP